MAQLRNSFTTRLLYTLMPATWYARKDASIRGLLQALAADLTALFEEGLTVTVPLKDIYKALLLFKSQPQRTKRILKGLNGSQCVYLCLVGVGPALSMQVAGQRKQFFVAFLGCKGDWPWLRKAYNLASGFTSRRVCHLCSGSDASMYIDKFMFCVFGSRNCLCIYIYI